MDPFASVGQAIDLMKGMKALHKSVFAFIDQPI